MEHVDWNHVSDSVINITSSSEFVYSHMSMYGVLLNKVEPSYGHSFLFLGTTVLPRFILDNRSQDIYGYYIERVRPDPFKGFSISNPTGWYLNLGVIGLVVGGFSLGLLVCFLHYLSYFGNGRFRLFYFLLLCLFLSDIVGFMRAGGPEPFRAVFIIKSLIPALIIYFMLKVSWKPNSSERV
ncbi:hypothetical protein GCM10023333_07730 [Ferrimonas pelagia]|uniref:O-antigen polysaccharide polymerase Wzy n=1 Tax=Ferrimonas pelagia TaxID=1177826 RepID=A0ABP9EH87_9GAMM